MARERVGLLAPEWDRGRWLIRGNLLLDVDAPVVGDWLWINLFVPYTVSVESDDLTDPQGFTGQVAILISNSGPDEKPGPGIRYPLGAPLITEPRTVSLVEPHAWVKAAVIALNSGSIKRIAIAGAGIQQ